MALCSLPVTVTGSFRTYTGFPFSSRIPDSILILPLSLSFFSPDVNAFSAVKTGIRRIDWAGGISL